MEEETELAGRCGARTERSKGSANSKSNFLSSYPTHPLFMPLC